MLGEMENLDITFFIPCYNEEGNITATLESIKEATKNLFFTFEIIVCDDASTDNTKQVVEDIINKNPQLNIRLICNAQNRGLGFNYYRGAFMAHGIHYMLINGDNVEPAETVRAIIQHCGEADMIIPYFGSQDKRSNSRKRISRTFSFLVNLLSGHRIYYYNGPVLHLTDNVRFWRAETAGYGYQAEMICRLLHEGMSYIQVEVSNTDRQWGFSKAFSLSNIFSVSNSLFHIFWRRLEYTVFNLLKPGVTKVQHEEEVKEEK